MNEQPDLSPRAFAVCLLVLLGYLGLLALGNLLTA